MAHPRLCQVLYGLLPALWRVPVGVSVPSKPSLPNGGHRHAQLVSQILVGNALKEGIRSGLEVHVCSPIDNGESTVYDSAYTVKDKNMNSILSAKYFHDEQAAYDFVEARLWPHGPV